MNVVSTSVPRQGSSAMTEASGGLSRVDLARLRQTVEFIREGDTASVVAATLPALSPLEQASLASHSCFSHAAMLVFPDSLAGLRDSLAALGLEAGDAMPSVVVRQRLCERYGLDDLEVVIVHAPVPDRNGRRCSVEIFALIGSLELARIAADEQARNHESHVALEVVDPDAVVLSGVSHLVTQRGRMSPDGGGYNAHVDSTVLYFRDPAGAGVARHRLEVVVSGHFPDSRGSTCVTRGRHPSGCFA